MAFRDGEVAGFERYLFRESRGAGIFLPSTVVKAIYSAGAAPKAVDNKPKARGGERLPAIPLNSDESMAAAVAFAKEFLDGVSPPGLLSAKFSADLLAGVLMQCVHTDPLMGWNDVLHYPIDPGWDCAKQMLHLGDLQSLPVANQPSVSAWIKKYLDNRPQNDRGLGKAAHEHWTLAMERAKAPALEVESETPSPIVIVFDAEELDNAVTRVADMSSERQRAGERTLEAARAEGGTRFVPDALAAAQRLDAQKIEFENLVEPIERLQTDLILASKMAPEEFRVAPILLLGEPGIGKTYLATQLAEALGVPSDKIGAGGAQGGFQLTGSHSSWLGSKPGAIATLLAQSSSAAPVMVIDETDKIGNDSRYPFLPVLLDLLDAGTARQFRDEFFEMRFNASHIVYVLTANSIENVPPALLSRVEVFTVPSPGPEQRLRIIQQTLAGLNKKTGQHIELVAAGAEQLAERLNIDLRALNRLVTSAFAKTIQSGAHELDLGDRKITDALKATLEKMLRST